MVQPRSFWILSLLFSAATFASACAGDDEASAEGELNETNETATNDAGRDAATSDANTAEVTQPANDGGASSTRDARAANDAKAPSTSDASTSPTKPEDSGAPPAAGDSKTLHISGNRILDTCDQPWVARGVEQLTGKSFSPKSSLAELAKELVKTGSNAVRLLPQIGELNASDIDALLTTFENEKVVVYLSPGDRAWFKKSDIKAVLLKHEKGLIIDAFQEPNYNDAKRWVTDGKAAVADIRGAGYTAPLTVLSNQFGRDLKAALEHGQEIADSDPLHNTIIGWQAYWGKSGWYQKDSGLSLTQGVEKCASMKFAMQVGIDLYADQNDPMDYSAVMEASEKAGISWLWWNWWNQYDNMGNNLSTDGTVARLTDIGKTIVTDHPQSIQKTAKKACFR